MQQKGKEKVFGRSEYGSGLLLSTDLINDAMNLNRHESYDSYDWNVAGEPDLHESIEITVCREMNEHLQVKARDLMRCRNSKVIAMNRDSTDAIIAVMQLIDTALVKEYPEKIAKA